MNIIVHEDKSLLAVTHLSQLLGFFTGIGGFIVALVLWLTQREKVMHMERQGKEILNFQISLFIYTIVCIPLIFMFGLGFLGFIIIGILGLVYPVINAIKASNGETPHYPFSIQIIK